MTLEYPGWDVHEDDHLILLRCHRCRVTYVFSAGGVSRQTLDDAVRVHVCRAQEEGGT
jgi:hypothetical protein